MRIFSGEAIVPSAIMSGSSTINSQAMPLPHIQGYSIQATYSTVGQQGVTGTFKLQMSNDKATSNWNDPANLVVNWTDITGSAVAIQASGSGNTCSWNVGGAYYLWARMVYTNTAGSGSMTVRATGKGPH